MSLEVVGEARDSSYLSRLNGIVIADVVLADRKSNKGHTRAHNLFQRQSRPTMLLAMRQIQLQGWQQ